jgi:hypothetical protein
MNDLGYDWDIAYKCKKIDDYKQFYDSHNIIATSQKIGDNDVVFCSDTITSATGHQVNSGFFYKCLSKKLNLEYVGKISNDNLYDILKGSKDHYLISLGGKESKIFLISIRGIILEPIVYETCYDLFGLYLAFDKCKEYLV